MGNEDCHVLELTANSRQTTYDHITYWVSAKRGVAVNFSPLPDSVRAKFRHMPVVARE